MSYKCYTSYTDSVNLMTVPGHVIHVFLLSSISSVSDFSEVRGMKNTSLCYIERGEQYLMLHRVKREEDENAGKWIGVGGKFEEGESPEDCVLREVYEVTGL